MADDRPSGELAIDGKGRVRMRRPGPRSWTRDKEKVFLRTLGETCNVKLAAAEAGVSPQRAYERRKTHAAFRAGWTEAVGAAYARLELILLDRALNGSEKIVRKRDGSEERMRDYSDRLALTLLKMHRETAAEADEEMEREDVDELKQAISDKLDRLKQREERRAAGTGEDGSKDEACA